MSASLDPEAILVALTETASAPGLGDRDAASFQIETVAFEPRAVGKRPSVSLAETARIFQRDHFTCCYCGRRPIPSVVMRCFSALWPREFPFHPHGKTSEAHFAYWTIMSSLEVGWTCNQTKGNAARTGNFTAYAEPDRGWDGLTASYPEL